MLFVAECIKALDKDPSRRKVIQYPFNLLPFQIEKLMHKLSFSVMGKVKLFSLVRTLLLRLSGSSDEKWTQSTQYLLNVKYFVEMVWYG